MHFHIVLIELLEFQKVTVKIIVLNMTNMEEFLALMNGVLLNIKEKK
jgi:hypothetical protein